MDGGIWIAYVSYLPHLPPLSTSFGYSYSNAGRLSTWAASSCPASHCVNGSVSYAIKNCRSLCVRSGHSSFTGAEKLRSIGGKWLPTPSKTSFLLYGEGLSRQRNMMISWKNQRCGAWRSHDIFLSQNCVENIYNHVSNYFRYFLFLSFPFLFSSFFLSLSLVISDVLLSSLKAMMDRASLYQFQARV